MAGNLKTNLQNVNELLSTERKSHADLPEPTVVAVSKKQPESKIRELYSLGVKDFGENYAQEALQKISNLSDLDIRWHFIGQIQSKKIKDLVGTFHLIHSVGRGKEVELMSQLAQEKSVTQDYLVQVNIANESTKAGVAPQDIMNWVQEWGNKPGLCLRGMMVFPPLSDTEEEGLAWFAKAGELFSQLQKVQGEGFDQLSMGTSSDYHLAYRSGATLLRIGESLMGPRSIPRR